MNRLKLKYIIIFSEIVLIAILLLLFYINYITIRDTLLSIEKRKIEKIIQSNLPTIQTLYKLGFDKDLNDVLTSIKLENPNISTIYISKTREPSALTFPIQYENQQLGYLIVDYKYTTTQKFLSQYKNQILYFLLFFLFIVLYSIYFLNKKLGAIYKLAEKIKETNLDKIKPVPLYDTYEEIQSITYAINYFLETIKKNFQKLRIIQRHLKEAQKIAKLSSWEFDPKKKFFYATTQLYRILQLNTNQKLTWQKFLDFFAPKDREIFIQELQNLVARTDIPKIELISKFITKNGEIYLKNIIKKQIRHNQIRLIAISMDVTEEIKAKKQVEFLAFHDALTGFYNRHALQKQLQFLKNLAKRENKKFSLFYIDIDNFKFINDTYGHTVGDQVLKIFSDRLKQLIRKSDLIFRLGGDEFLILFYDTKNDKALEKIAKKIIHISQQPITIDNRSFHIQCSIGIALYPDTSTNIDELIQFADIAMYEAKKMGKNTYKIFNDTMKKSQAASHNIVNDLKLALQKDDELQLYIQPKINLHTKKISGGEILIRWFHPQKGLISPGEFISLAEESNLILQIDEYVLKKSFQKILEWQKRDIKDIKIAINLSAKQFKNPLFDKTIETILTLYPIDTSLVELEVTETASMEEIGRSIDILKYLKNLGFSIAIDDFGTGYSSLNYIKKLPFDTLKIDRSFVQDINKDKDNRAITELIIKIAKVLQKDTIAEGVESAVHERILYSLSCDYAQGFYYYKPMPLEEFEKLLRSQ